MSTQRNHTKLCPTFPTTSTLYVHHLDPLEQRQLLSGAGIAINFQPATAPVPAGYEVDAGLAYGNRGNGMTYGWLGGDHSAWTRDRNSPNAPSQKHDTLNHFNDGSTTRTWELAVANGDYYVHLGLGDPSYDQHVSNIDVEGRVFTDPDLGDHFDGFSGIVTVADGRLTVQTAPGGSNAKIQFIDIDPVDSTREIDLVGLDVGPVDITGTTTYDAVTGHYTVTGSGTLQGDYTDDAAQFAHTAVDGDFSFVARVASLSGDKVGPRAGIMVRQSLEPNAPMVFLGMNQSHSGHNHYSINRQFFDGDRRQVTWNAGPVVYPQWFRLDRSGEIFTSYTSDDGQSWEPHQALTMTGWPDDTVAVGVAVTSNVAGKTSTAVFDHLELSPVVIPDHETTYFGNSVPGGSLVIPEAAYTTYIVPETGETLLVGDLERDDFVVFDADGNIKWEHGEHRGGYTVTGNADHYFYALGHSTSTVNNRNYDGLIRLDHNGDNQVHILPNHEVRGLALSGNTLFVADRTTQTIRRFNTATMIEIGTGWSVTDPAALATDLNGNLWAVLEPTDPMGQYEVRHYSPTGTDLGHTITSVERPRGMAVHPTTGELYVTDIGPSQQVRRFSTTGVALGQLGAAGGITSNAYGTLPGEVHPDKFNFPVGIGFDSQGHMVLANNGSPGYWSRYSRGSGLVLTKYDTTQSVVWEKHGLEFVDLGDVDPATDGTTILTKDSIYTFDRTKPIGEQWTYFAHTIDPYAYPDDPRLFQKFFDADRADGWAKQGNAVVARVDGQRVLYVNKMEGTGIAWYRFEAGSHIAIPSGWMEADTDIDDNGTKEWVFWQDANGNGQREASEVEEFSAAGSIHGYKVTDDGKVWVTSDSGTLRLFETTLVNGVPTLASPSTVTVDSAPALFDVGEGFRRVLHDSITDTAIVSGSTTAHPQQSGNGVKDAGTVLALYENWSDPATRTLVTQRTFDVTNAELSGQHRSDVISDIAAANHYVFAVRNPDTREVQVYRRDDLALIDRFAPGPEIGAKLGINDLAFGINVQYLEATNEYMILLEDDLGQKGVVIYWSPSQQGTILRETWHDVTGTDIADVPVSTTPDVIDTLDKFQIPVNSGDNYATRIRGYLHPNITGDYVFWISGNNDADLYLSTDDDPNNTTRIAYVDGFTGNVQWDKYASQQSQPITLEAGKRYYIEALHKEGGSGDNLAVGWTKPGDTLQPDRPTEIIPGDRLSPFELPQPEQGNGLAATYYNNKDLTGSTVTRIDAGVNFTWSNGQSPNPAIGDNTFSARWIGQVQAESSGAYTFSTRSDDGIRLYIDGRVVINNWTNHAATWDHSSLIWLDNGEKVDLVLEYYEDTGDAKMELHWTPPGQAQELIPTGRLYNDGPPPIDFSAASFSAFGQGQDGQNSLPTSVTVEDNGATVHLTGNAWKKTAFNYDVVANTYLTFEVSATNVGELIGIGLDRDNTHNNHTERLFVLGGSQSVPSDMIDYPGNYTVGDGWVSYTINIGAYYTGLMNYLTFMADDDDASQPLSLTDIRFRNLRIYNV